MSENTNLTGTHTMHRCAEIHNAMLELTGNAYKTRMQYCKLGNARIIRDVKNLQTIHSLLTENFPFPEKAELLCISTGLTVPQDSDINCDRANEIGVKIQQPIGNQIYTFAEVPLKEKIATLATLHSTLKIDNKVIDIDPLILFSRPILPAEREEDATPYFEHELTNYPLSLFKDGMMRNGNKASLM